MIVETIQAEGGVNVASSAWLRELERACRTHGIVLVVDDVQVGCGRTGTFFSFEDAGIRPDVICLSKALSGIGLPLALVLVRPELDVWQPGQHNGTFRGNNLAFVAATRALQRWRGTELPRRIAARETTVREALMALMAQHGSHVRQVRGRGLIWGLELAAGLADRVAAEAFASGLLVETCGTASQVLKLLPTLAGQTAALEAGLERLGGALEVVARDHPEP